MAVRAWIKPAQQVDAKFSFFHVGGPWGPSGSGSGRSVGRQSHAPRRPLYAAPLARGWLVHSLTVPAYARLLPSGGRLLLNLAIHLPSSIIASQPPLAVTTSFDLLGITWS